MNDTNTSQKFGCPASKSFLHLRGVFCTLLGPPTWQPTSSPSMSNWRPTKQQLTNDNQPATIHQPTSNGLANQWLTDRQPTDWQTTQWPTNQPTSDQPARWFCQSIGAQDGYRHHQGIGGAVFGEFNQCKSIQIYINRYATAEININL